MDVPPLLLQSVGSLIAIFALYWLARSLKLGDKPVLDGESAVRDAANEVVDGFDAQRISITRGGGAALARDGLGKIMLIKRHGNRFAGRLLDSMSSVREQVDALIVDSGEAQFGEVRLSIDDPDFWADAINRL